MKTLPDDCYDELQVIYLNIKKANILNINQNILLAKAFQYICEQKTIEVENELLHFLHTKGSS